MSDDTYNGWRGHETRASAYATWRLNLEISDDTIQNYASDPDGPRFADVAALADALKDDADEVITNYGELEGLAVDYARAFLDNVNWREIAETAIVDHPQLVAADDDEENL